MKAETRRFLTRFGRAFGPHPLAMDLGFRGVSQKSNSTYGNAMQNAICSNSAELCEDISNKGLACPAPKISVSH
jgi:hypothetical protein